MRDKKLSPHAEALRKFKADPTTYVEKEARLMSRLAEGLPTPQAPASASVETVEMEAVKLESDSDVQQAKEQ